MKFTFTSEFTGFGSPKTSMQFEADSIEDVLMYFTDFLRGAGYHFDGQVDIIPTDDFQVSIEESDLEKELPFANYGGEKCSVCGLTRQAMGQAPCHDVRCGLGLNRV